MALNSMQEIFEKAASRSIPFWRVVLETDMEERQVTEEQSMEKMRAAWHAMLECACCELSGGATLPQRPCGRRRRPDAALRRGGYYIQRPLCAGGHCYGPQRRRVQRLHAEDRGGTNRRRLRCTACGTGASVPDGPRHRGRDFAGPVHRFRHWCGGQRASVRSRRCARALPGRRAAVRRRSARLPLWRLAL